MVLGAQFHGTSHWFSPGELVKPSIPATGRKDHAAAWATPKKEAAARYSAEKSNKLPQPPLFSPFYEVENTSNELRTHPMSASVGDRRGLRVLRVAGYADSAGNVI